MNIYPDEEVRDDKEGEQQEISPDGTTDVPEQMPEGAQEAMEENDREGRIDAPADNPDAN